MASSITNGDVGWMSIWHLNFVLIHSIENIGYNGLVGVSFSFSLSTDAVRNINRPSTLTIIIYWCLCSSLLWKILLDQHWRVQCGYLLKIIILNFLIVSIQVEWICSTNRFAKQSLPNFFNVKWLLQRSKPFIPKFYTQLLKAIPLNKFKLC